MRLGRNLRDKLKSLTWKTLMITKHRIILLLLTMELIFLLLLVSRQARF